MRRPWIAGVIDESTESAKYLPVLFRSFRASSAFLISPRGDALRACPWLTYFAPSVLLRLVVPSVYTGSALALADICRAFGAKQRESWSSVYKN